MKKIAEAYRGGKLITPPYKFYTEMNGDGSWTPYNCELIVSGDYLFYCSPNLSSSIFHFENCKTAIRMFDGTRGGKITINLPVAYDIGMILEDGAYGEVEIFAPLATGCWGILNRCYPVTKLSLYAPKATNIAYALCQCALIESIEFDASEVIFATNFCFFCKSLKNVRVLLPKCTSATGAFFGCALEAETINAILESLPTYTTGSHVITFTGCPGAATCNPEIATEKGWTVEL